MMLLHNIQTIYSKKYIYDDIEYIAIIYNDESEKKIVFYYLTQYKNMYKYIDQVGIIPETRSGFQYWKPTLGKLLYQYNKNQKIAEVVISVDASKSFGKSYNTI